MNAHLAAFSRLAHATHHPSLPILAHLHFTDSYYPAAGADCYPPDFAQRQHCQVLLNCYAREVAIQEHNLAVRAIEHLGLPPPALRWYRGQVLEIHLPRMDSRLCVGVQQVSVTGNFDYTSPVYLQNQQQAWREADWRDLAHLIIGDLSLRENVEFSTDLLQQVEESVATMQRFLDARRPARPSTPTMNALQKYIRSEQDLLTGHPFHPTPKSRSGWSREEEQKYSPEHQVQLQLHYFRLPVDWIISDSLDGENVPTLLAQLTDHGLSADANHAIVPLHPWQADWLRQQPYIIKALQHGEISDLGSGGQRFYPTASIRTMLSAKAENFLKLSLNVRITNCIRNNARHELAAALTASRLYRTVKTEMQARFPYFHVLEERACLTVAFPCCEQGREIREIEDGFGLVVREGLSGQIEGGTTPMICASLFGNGQSGRLEIASLIERYAHRHGLPLSHGMRLWFARYAELAIYPVFYLLFEKGIAFEPHLQNTVVCLAGDGSPARFIVRDLELTRLTTRAHELIDTLEIAEKTRQEICCSDEAGWIRIGYCLLVNHICEVIAALSNGSHDLHLDLWGCLRNILQGYLTLFPNPLARRRIQGLLSGEPLPAKGNLLIRFLKQADRHAAYLPLHHPLGVVSGHRSLL